MRAEHPIFRREGFTLLEVMLALGILALLIGAITGVYQGAVTLTQSINQSNDLESRDGAFVRLVSELFQGLPGHAEVDLTYEDDGRHYLSDFMVYQADSFFPSSSLQMRERSVALRTLKDGKGSLDVVLTEVSGDYVERLEGVAVLEEGLPDFERSLSLLKGLRFFEWKIYDSALDEWIFEWERGQGRPRMVELNYAYLGDALLHKHVFWIPPASNPELAARQISGTTSQPEAAFGGGGNGPGGGSFDGRRRGGREGASGAPGGVGDGRERGEGGRGNFGPPTVQSQGGAGSLPNHLNPDHPDYDPPDDVKWAETFKRIRPE
ncbi:MAG: prepilin-type N-terminal cleavage/methylation domain-containing protein [Verrucomicrobiota bacterium]